MGTPPVHHLSPAPCPVGSRPGSGASLALLSLALAVGPTLSGCGGEGGGASTVSGERPEEIWWDEARTLIRTRGTTRYGKLIGEYSEWHRKGQLAKRGTYSDDGVEIGEWRTYHPSGRDESVAHYQRGLQVGEAIEWYDNGQVAHRGRYEAGAKVGEWMVYWREGGEPKERVTYVDGLMEGPFEAYYPGGEVRLRVQMTAGNATGTQTTYFESGELRGEIEMVNGLQHGLETVFHEGGMKLSELRWVNGKREGKTQGWFPNAERQLLGHFENGLPVGEWTQWHANGVVEKVGSHAGGVQVGEWRLYYDSGSLEWVLHYVAGRNTGLFQAWHPDGRRRAHGMFQDDLREGAFYECKGDGTLDAQETGIYKGGQRLGDLGQAELAAAQALAADPTEREN